MRKRASITRDLLQNGTVVPVAGTARLPLRAAELDSLKYVFATMSV